MSSIVSSLPDRPLKQSEFTALNHADAFTLALPIDAEEAVERETMEATEIAESIILATDDWAKALRYDDGWRVLKTVAMEDAETARFDALQQCKQALADE